jgi:hypothetical protein
MDEVVPVSVVRQEAARLGISEHMLHHFSREGLLARTIPGRARGRKLGRPYFYPIRALHQLECLAQARRWRRDVLSLRHWIWWSGDGLEEWQRWREDRERELEEMGKWARSLASLPRDGEREEHAIGFAEYLGSVRETPFPRRRVRGAERVTFSTYFLDLVANDLSRLVGDASLSSGDPEFVVDLLRKNLAEPVDSDPKRTLGSLLAQAMKTDNIVAAPEADRWLMAIQLWGFIPDLQEAATRMALMTQGNASRLRDVAVRLIREGRIIEDLAQEPTLAALVLLMLSTISSLAPQLLDLEALQPGV